MTATVPKFFVLLDNSRYLTRTNVWSSLKSLARPMTQREADDYIRDFGPMYGVKNLRKVTADQ